MNGENEISVPAIADDHVIAMAQRAEKRIEAVNKIKGIALKVTNSNDWVDEGGKPYLQASGSEKVARLFGISWRIGKATTETEADGHFAVYYEGEFTNGSDTITAQGKRSSKDPFFARAHGQDIPPDKIDKADLMQAAYTNCIGNGITRFLGLRNLSWAELEQYNIRPGAGVDRGVKKQEQTGEEKDIAKRLGSMLLELCEPPNDPAAASAMLEQFSSFTGKDNKQVPGKKKLSDLTGKWLQSTYGKVKEEYKKRYGLTDEDMEKMWARQDQK